MESNEVLENHMGHNETFSITVILLLVGFTTNIACKLSHKGPKATLLCLISVGYHLELHFAITSD